MMTRHRRRGRVDSAQPAPVAADSAPTPRRERAQLRRMTQLPTALELPDGIDPDDVTDLAVRKALRTAERHARRTSDRAIPTGLRWAGQIGAGQPGRYPGRVAWPIHMPAHFESTAAVRGLYPWLAGSPLPQAGPVFGRELVSGGLWCFDPWEQRRLGKVGDSGVFISGVIGSGKSAAAKSLVLRHGGFGRPFVVPADIRGEWVPVARAVDGLVLQLGPGMPHRLNALAMPRKPDSMRDAEWWKVVHTHWTELVSALAETLMPGQRQLAPVEKTAVELALREATHYDAVSGDLARLKPISLHPVIALLRDPTEAMVDEIGMPKGDLIDATRDVALSLRSLTQGLMQGLVDSPEADNIIDSTRAATVVDISRVQQSDAAIALVMACTQSVMELAFIHQVQQWWTVYDELWRLARFAPLLGRLNSSQRRSRSSGAGTLLLTHRVTDSMMGGEQAQRAMLDLITDCATKIIYRQRADAIDATRTMVSMTDMVANLLPTMPRGRAVHVVDGQPYLVDHLLPPKQLGVGGVDRPLNEWDVIETDQALRDDYRTLAGRSESTMFADFDSRTTEVAS